MSYNDIKSRLSGTPGLKEKGDVFDAVSQKRCYRDAMTLDQSFNIIEKGAGTDFDPHLARLFLEARDEVAKLVHEKRLYISNKELII